MQIRNISCTEKDTINNIASMHLEAFPGFFLTFLGKGFLKLMYRSYTEYKDSGIFVAFEKNEPVGFLAYSGDLSGLYKYMIKKRLFPFAWYSFGAFCRKPKVFMRLIRAFMKPQESKRAEKYVELASLGVVPKAKSKGVGTMLVDKLKATVDFKSYAYITLETDVVNNDIANSFYKKNGFLVEREFQTNEGRRIYEYRYSE